MHTNAVLIKEHESFFYNPFFLRILNVFFIFSLFFIIFDTPKNFQQKFASYTYYFPYFMSIISMIAQ